MNRTTQEQYVFGSILLLANKMTAWGDGILDEITFKQWFLLLLISKMETNNPTVKEIADFSGTSRQNTKKMLEQLESKKFIVLSKSETDARALKVALSDKTWEYFATNEQKAADLVNDIFLGIADDELHSICKTLDKLLLYFGNPTPNTERTE